MALVEHSKTTQLARDAMAAVSANLWHAGETDNVDVRRKRIRDALMACCCAYDILGDWVDGKGHDPRAMRAQVEDRTRQLFAQKRKSTEIMDDIKFKKQGEKL